MLEYGLQVVSDIHLEFRGKHVVYSNLLPRKATDLALCGDIGRPFMEVSGAICHYKQFLMYAADTWRHVFIVTGNHCYYGHRKSDTDARVQAYCNERPNLHFLNDSAYIFTQEDNVRLFHGIYGSTLWTDVTDAAFANMNDHRIRPERHFVMEYTRKSACISADTIRNWHTSHKDAMQAKLTEHKLPEGKKWIVMTHHPPRPPPVFLKEGVEMHADAATWSAYINDLPKSLFDDSKIAVWLCGHLHAHFDSVVDGIRYVSNCMGYPTERNVGYDASCLIEYMSKT